MSFIKRHSRYLLLFTAISLVCVLLSFSLPGDTALEIVRYTSKPMIVLLLLLGVYFGVRCVQSQKPPVFDRNRWLYPGLLALLVVGSISLRESKGFKVLNDEYIIGAQAKSMHERGTSDFPTRSIWVYEDLLVLNAKVDKRPPVFSVLLSLVHDGFGYRVDNVFVLNAVIAFLFLFLLGFLVWKPKIRLSGNFKHLTLLAFMVLSYREYAINTTGGGLDLLNVTLIAYAACLGCCFVKTGSRNILGLWMVLNLLLINTRHESILYVLSFGLIYLLATWKRKRLIVGWYLFLIPVYCMLYVFRFNAFRMYPVENMQLPEGVFMFSSKYFFENLGHAIEYFYQFDTQNTSSVIISILGLVGLILFILRTFRGGSPRSVEHMEKQVLLAYGIIVLVNFALVLFYFWGRIDEQEVSRLSMPLVLLLGFGMWQLCRSLMETKAAAIILVFMAVYSVSYAIPRKTSEIHLHENYYFQIDEYAREIIDTFNSKNVIVVCSRPAYWYLYDIAALDVSKLPDRIGNLIFQQRSESINVFFLEEFRRDPVSLNEFESSLGDSKALLNTEVLGEYSFKPYHYCRILRLVVPKDIGLPEGTIRVLPSEMYRENPVEAWFFHTP